MTLTHDVSKELKKLRSSSPNPLHEIVALLAALNVVLDRRLAALNDRVARLEKHDHAEDAE